MTGVLLSLTVLLLCLSWVAFLAQERQRRATPAPPTLVPLEAVIKPKDKGRVLVMGQCNFCTMQQIRAANARKKIEIKPDNFGLGGVSAYVNGKPVAWFMELPDHCCCGG